MQTPRSAARTFSLTLILGTAFFASCALASPEEDIAAAVTRAGASSVADARPQAFVLAFSAVIARVTPHDLSTYVAAAISLRPDLTAKSVFVGVRAALRTQNTEQAAVNQIIRAAVAANPSDAAEIAKSGVSAFPGFSETILGAANQVPAAQRAAIFKAVANSRGYASLHHGQHHGRDGGPVEDGDQDNDDVNSPEQPPHH